MSTQNPSLSSSLALTDRSAAVPDADAPSEGKQQTAFNKMLPFILALVGAVLSPILMDAFAMAVAVLAVVPRVRALRAQIAALPGVDVRCVDHLEDSAYALMWASVQYRIATRPPEQLVKMHERGIELRARLYSTSQLLTQRAIVDARELGSYVGIKGYQNVIADLALLAGTLQKHWPHPTVKALVRADEIDEALALSAEMAAMLATRSGAPSEQVSEAAQVRLLTYNLVLGYYEELRAAVAFIRRHEGDADTLVPSLFTRRRKPNAGTDEAGDSKEDDHENDVAKPSGAASLSRPAPGMPGEDPFDI